MNLEPWGGTAVGTGQACLEQERGDQAPRLCSPPPCSAQQDSPEAEAVTHWGRSRADGEAAGFDGGELGGGLREQAAPLGGSWLQLRGDPTGEQS